MKVTLLHPFVGGGLQSASLLGMGRLGSGYLGACLLKEGHTVRVLDAENGGDHRRRSSASCRGVPPSGHLRSELRWTHEIHAAANACKVVKRNQRGAPDRCRGTA